MGIPASHSHSRQATSCRQSKTSSTGRGRSGWRGRRNAVGQGEDAPGGGEALLAGGMGQTLDITPFEQIAINFGR